MSMSTHIVGFVPPDEKWRKFKKIYHSCMEAGIDIPEEVEAFFDGEEPDDNGMVVNIENLGCITEYFDEMREGLEIDLTKLPDNIKIIRFYNSW